MKRFPLFATIWALSISPLDAQTLALPKDDRPLVESVQPGEPLASVSSLFGGLARDLRRLPSLDTAILLGVAGAASVAIRNHDQRITARLASSATLDRVFEPGEMAGNGLVQGSAAVATYAVGRFMKSPKGTAVGADPRAGAAAQRGADACGQAVRGAGAARRWPLLISIGSFLIQLCVCIRTRTPSRLEGRGARVQPCGLRGRVKAAGEPALRHRHRVRSRRGHGRWPHRHGRSRFGAVRPVAGRLRRRRRCGGHVAWATLAFAVSIKCGRPVG